MAHPAKITFPGSVRFAPKPAKVAEGEPAWQEPKDEAGKPLKAVLNHDAKGVFTGTTVTVPLGKTLVYTEAPGNAVWGGVTRPTYVVRMVDDAPTFAHAELEHREADEHGPAIVVATSTKHADEEGAPLAAVGSDAADAVKHLHAAIDAKTAKEKAAAEKPEPQTEVVERTG